MKRYDLGAASAAVLRREADGGERIEVVASADARGAFYDGVRVHDAPVAEHDARAEDRVGPNVHVEAELGAWMHDGRGVDFGHRLSSCLVR